MSKPVIPKAVGGDYIESSKGAIMRIDCVWRNKTGPTRYDMTDMRTKEKWTVSAKYFGKAIDEGKIRLVIPEYAIKKTKIQHD